MLLAITAACTTDKEKQAIEDTATQFAASYFGCHYDKAMKLCDEESRKWIVFTATNVTDRDLEILNSSSDEPCFNIKDINIDNDTAATVVVEANNYLNISAIDTVATMSKAGTYTLRLRHTADGWRVALRAVPAPERTQE